MSYLKPVDFPIRCCLIFYSTSILWACGSKPESSHTKSVISRDASVIIYHAAVGENEFVLRRYCDPAEVTPKRDCKRTNAQGAYLEKPTSLFRLNDFRYLMARTLLTTDSAASLPELKSFFGNNGDERLRLEIDDQNEFLQRKNMSMNQQESVKNRISQLKRIGETKILINKYVDDIKSKDLIGLPSYSEEVRNILRVFDSPEVDINQDESLQMFDPSTGLWWASLSRNFPNSHMPIWVEACARKFGKGYRLPTCKELDIMSKGPYGVEILKRFAADRPETIRAFTHVCEERNMFQAGRDGNFQLYAMCVEKP